MKTELAFAMGQANRGKSLMVFDWDKAAQRIRETGAQDAGAGLAGDWEYTGGRILKEGKPIPRDDTYTYLASTWATPELDLDGDVEPCYVMEDEARRRWGDVEFSNLYWTDSALQILNQP